MQPRHGKMKTPMKDEKQLAPLERGFRKNCTRFKLDLQITADIQASTNVEPDYQDMDADNREPRGGAAEVYDGAVLHDVHVPQ
ncbi:hypothetical protein NDU88_003387 [Pleurodeles waltl]|uniref:Uncharacterized protein n=1 Tax=Pleurodeles waltl TaxID=8319 RepID=A0AAV7UYB7_PLEWA|nr:hypothetical protein NDU88_003387 [Pleurodeles waltl]